MANLKQSRINNNPSEKDQKIFVLRWGHRIHRDARLTSHVALTSRALGCSGFILSDSKDLNLKETVEKIAHNWGGKFIFQMGDSWKSNVKNWKNNGGIIVHLTAYGENIQTSDVLNRIKLSKSDILLIVGSQKVPKIFYTNEVSDFNVSIGNQPHSECSALAIFLDRFFDGKELCSSFKEAKIKIIPQKRGKKTLIS
jgi:tRNA (cytidine56-2'-O)-methyltransferase